MSVFMLSVNVPYQSKKNCIKVSQPGTVFIHDYCNVGERLNSTPLDQRAGEFFKSQGRSSQVTCACYFGLTQRENKTYLCLHDRRQFYNFQEDLT